MMKFINNFKYLIEVDFECEDFLATKKKELIQFYRQQIEFQKKVFDCTLIDTPINTYFSPKIRKIIENIFIVDQNPIPTGFNVYVQNNTMETFKYHSHIHLPASICGVFYTSLPKRGGGLEIIHPPSYPIDDPLILRPQINKLYLFPSWLYHKPMPQEDEIERICINISYFSYTRPTVKGYGVMW